LASSVSASVSFSFFIATSSLAFNAATIAVSLREDRSRSYAPAHGHQRITNSGVNRL
jgi:hypothetical protein